jgi:flagellar hook assembly protein FlgD
VELKIYNLTGQEIKTLVNEYQTAGNYVVVWDGTPATGDKAPSGIYWYQIRAGKFVQVRKLVLMR